MVEIVAAQIARVLDTLESFRAQWTPALVRHIDQVRHVCNELVNDEDPEAELSVTAQVVIEQTMEKLNSVLAEVIYNPHVM